MTDKQAYKCVFVLFVIVSVLLLPPTVCVIVNTVAPDWLIILMGLLMGVSLHFTDVAHQLYKNSALH